MSSTNPAIHPWIHHRGPSLPHGAIRRVEPYLANRYANLDQRGKITDLLFNPMVLMMSLPLLIILVLPKMISDPETKKEMENLNLSKMTNDMPEISEMINSFFTGGAPTAAAAAAIKDKEKTKSGCWQSKKNN